MNKKIQQRLGAILALLVYSYSGAVVLWIAVWFFGSDNQWLRVLLSHNGARLFWLLIPLGLGALLLRRWGALVALLVPLAFLFYLAGPYLRPHLQGQEWRAAKVPPDLTVLTFNVLHHNRDYARIADFLQTYDPDLIAFQETTEELFATLQTDLGETYPYALKSNDPIYSATAIFSRYPVDEFYIVDLGEVRPLVVARLTVEGRRIKFISAHLRYYFGWWNEPLAQIPARLTELTELQHEQVRRLLADAQRHDDDILLLGCDCNAPETSDTQVMLSDFFVNSAKATGWVRPQPELPWLGPFYFPQRIDYLFHRGAIEPLAVYTILDQAGSDHAAVLGFFRFGE